MPYITSTEIKNNIKGSLRIAIITIIVYLIIKTCLVGVDFSEIIKLTGIVLFFAIVVWAANDDVYISDPSCQGPSRRIYIIKNVIGYVILILAILIGLAIIYLFVSSYSP